MWSFVVAGTAIAGLLLWFSRRNEWGGGGVVRDLQALGFSPCETEIGKILERITWMHNSARQRFVVRRPMRATVGGEAVYYCVAERHQHDDVFVAQEFLVPLRRPSEEGVLLTIKPTEVAHGVMTKLIGNVASFPWDSKPGGLKKLDLPRELHNSNVIAVSGTPGKSLHDLVQPEVLEHVQRLGDAGVLMMLCRGDWCRLMTPSGRIPLKPAELWPIIEAFVRTQPSRAIPVS